MSDAPAGPLLAIDTSTAAGSVAIGNGDRVLVEVVLGITAQHSTALMPAIDAALRWAALERKDLTGLVVSGGPGSFTGLRIGAATVKGISHALDLPVWSYSGLLAAAASVAAPASSAPRTICALFDARRGSVFAAAYRFRAEGRQVRIDTVLAPQVLELQDLLGRLPREEEFHFTGDGALAYEETIRQSIRAVFAPRHLAIPRAASLLWLASISPEAGRVPEPRSWEPDYLRASGAERIAAERAPAD